MYCRHCGHENAAAATRCANCGRPLMTTDDTTGALPAHEREAVERLDEAPTPPAPPAGEEGVAVPELQPDTALLFAVRGPNEGARFLLDKGLTTVGRHPDSDIFLDDITVSRRHAEFRREGGRFFVHDGGSLNGTYVNGERADERQIRTGDEVQVGKFKLVAYVAPSRT